MINLANLMGKVMDEIMEYQIFYFLISFYYLWEVECARINQFC